MTLKVKLKGTLEIVVESYFKTAFPNNILPVKLLRCIETFWTISNVKALGNN